MNVRSRVEIGENVRKYRKVRGLTQADLAERVTMLKGKEHGGNPQTISRIENATSDYGVDTFLTIAAALEISPEILLTTEKE